MPHPVRQEIVDGVRQRTNKWKPLDVDKNPLARVDADKLMSGRALGNLGKVKPAAGARSGTHEPNPALELLLKPIEFLRGLFLGSQEVRSDKLTVQTSPADMNKVYGKKQKTIKGDPSLPSHYNVREAYPHCKPEVFQQGECGACWGFASAGILGDRICMATGRNVTLSPQDMVNCALEQYGCNGGFLIPAIDFLVSEGTVEAKCRPYKQKSETCEARCEGNQLMPYEKFYCKAGTMKIMSTRDEIQREIFKSGPVIVSLNVYEDFYNYKEGIYEHTWGGDCGGHSMRLVGWGHDEAHDSDGSLYWIA